MKSLIYGILITLFIGTFLFANIINVPADVPTIQRAIDEAERGDIVLVAEGEYYENINFDGKSITVASMFLFEKDESIISNTIIDGSEPSIHQKGSVVSFTSGEDTNSVIYGFTIRGGSGTLVDEDKIYKFGGGIACLNSGAKISYNKIEYNSVKSKVPSFGAGIGHGPSSDASYIIVEHNWIENNTVEGNAFCSGGGINMYGNGRITENKIRYNLAKSFMNACKGGGVHARGTQAASVEISNNTIIANQVTSTAEYSQDKTGGGGIWIGEYSNSMVFGNRFQNNKVRSDFESFGAGIMFHKMDASNEFCGNHIVLNYRSGLGSGYGGGVCMWRSQVCSFNNIISHNRSTYGGGLYICDEVNNFQENQNPTLTNCTIVENTASAKGGGIFVENSQPVIMNSIVWDNSATEDPGIHVTQGELEKIFVLYSDVQDLRRDSNGNISTDPLFVNSDFQLSDSSPCIGAGIDGIVVNGTTCCCPNCCVLGKPRPLPANSMPDMGAHENSLESPSGLISFDHILPQDISLKQNYPNPFNPSTTIEFSLPKEKIVTLKIYNLLGQEVGTLVSDKLTSGNYKYAWDASAFTSGVYYYKIVAGRYTDVKKLIVMK